MAYYAGKLNQPITIERVSANTVDRYGRPGKTWETVCSVFAGVRDVSGREFFEAAAYQRENTVTFVTRWVPCLSTAMRIVYNGDVYEIDEVNHHAYKGDFMSIRARKTEAEAYG